MSTTHARGPVALARPRSATPSAVTAKTALPQSPQPWAIRCHATRQLSPYAAKRFTESTTASGANTRIHRFTGRSLGSLEA